jgi:hypothetical protein
MRSWKYKLPLLINVRNCRHVLHGDGVTFYSAGFLKQDSKFLTKNGDINSNINNNTNNNNINNSYINSNNTISSYNNNNNNRPRNRLIFNCKMVEIKIIGAIQIFL